ncbi:MAG TPA: MFS transporter [Stellaceae bacterium]|nr:MFS transporter [Stellaceae bacterium]
MPRDFDLPEITQEASLPRPAFRALVLDGVFSQSLGVLTSGALLVGCALALGASPAYVGVLSAIPLLSQLAHVPAVILIERVRRRKAICIAVTLAARLMLLPLLIVPLTGNRDLALALLAGFLAISCPLGAVGGCAWMSWTSDLVPRARLGRIFSHRQLAANLAATLAGLAGAGIVDEWARQFPEFRLGGYCGVFALAIAAAMLSTWFLTRMPDVPMKQVEPAPLARLFARPFRDRNYRRVMTFLGAWNFAINLAMPFFTVYLVRDLGTPLTVPIILTVLAQLANTASLPWWGRLCDRYSNKAAIALAGPALLFAILLWVAAAEPAPHAMTFPLIFAAQVLVGAAGAGLDLACGNLAYKSAPAGETTVYLGTNGLIKSLAGGTAPLAGGMLAQGIAGTPIHIAIGSLMVIDLAPLTILFLAAAGAGALALLALAPIAEAGRGFLRLRLWRRAQPAASAGSGAIAPITSPRS